MTTREAIEARLKEALTGSGDYVDYYYGGQGAGACCDDIRDLLSALAAVEAERDDALESLANYQTIYAGSQRKRTAAEARAEALARAVKEKALEIERHCPCGARPESLQTHPHVTGCPVAAILAMSTEQ